MLAHARTPVWGASGAASQGLALFQEFSPTPEAFLRPVFIEIVVLRARRGVRWKNEPWLLRRCEDVDVRRKAIRLEKCSNPDKMNQIACTVVVAPQGDAAGRTTTDLLPSSTLGGRHHRLRRASQHDDTIGLDQGVDDKRGSGLTLTPSAVAAMHEQRFACQPVSNGPARAHAFEGLIVGCFHKLAPVPMISITWLPFRTASGSTRAR